MQFLIWAFLTILVIVALINVFIYVFQENLIFQGSNVPIDFQYNFKEDFSEIYLEPEPGARIHIVHFKLENPEGAILYFHGNRSDIRRWGIITGPLTIYGYDVFVMDYRGYGKSQGNRTEDKIYEDATLLYKYVSDHFSYPKVVVFGRSLGSAVAMELATRCSIDQLILETPISHISNALYRYRWLIYQGLISKFKFDSLSKVSAITCPTIILHGTWDLVVPIKFAKDLMQGLAAKDKKFIQVNKGGHNNLNNFEFYHSSLKIALSNSLNNERV